MTIAANSVEITQQIEWISAEQWRDSLASAHRQGWVCLDVLTAIDRPEQREFHVVLHANRVDSALGQWWGVVVPQHDAELASLVDVFKAAAWHERETREMFGITFTGNVVSHDPTAQGLLLSDEAPVTPLRKHVPLGARVDTPWPGNADPDPRRSASRRRQAPPGTRPEWFETGDGQ